MTPSTFESASQRRSPGKCPHCGRSVNRAKSTEILETVLGALAAVAMLLILFPLAMTAWRSCADVFSNDDSGSVVFHPLEDWSHY